MPKNFRKRESTAFLTKELLNIPEEKQEQEQATAEEQEKTSDSEQTSKKKSGSIQEMYNNYLSGIDLSSIDFLQRHHTKEQNEIGELLADNLTDNSHFFTPDITIKKKVTKNARLQILLNSELLEELKKAAVKNGVSTNELVNQILTWYLYKKGE